MPSAQPPGIPAQKAPRVLPALLAVFSCAYILLFFFVALSRFRYPLQLEWLECGVLDTVARVLAHRQIYVPPSADFVPFIYTPLYYYVAALACKVAGLHFATLRLLSTAATAGSLLLIYALTHRLAQNRSRFSGLLAAGLFAALYGANDSWYDLARVDMLFVFLVLAALFASYRGHAFAAGLLFALAYQTKQGALLIAVLVLLHEAGRTRKLLLGLGSFALFTAGSVFLLNHASGGWYIYYTEFLPRHHALFPMGLFIFFAKDLIFRLLPALLLIGALAWPTLRRHDLRTRDTRFLLAATLGTFLSALAGRAHSGGSINVTLPFYAWLAVLFGLAMHRLLSPDAHGPHGTPPRRPAAVFGLALLQFLILFYVPGRLILSREAHAHANAVLDRLAAIPGRLYVFDNSVDLIERGRPSAANSDAIFDVLRGDSGAAAASLKQSLDAAFREQRFSAIVSDRPLPAGSFPYPGATGDLLAPYATGTPEAFPFAADTRTVEPPPVAPLYLFPLRAASPPRAATLP